MYWPPGVIETSSKFVAGVTVVNVNLGKDVTRTVIDTGDKFSASANDAGGQLAAGGVDTGGAPWAANIFANFQKNLKWPCWEGSSGAQGKMIHEKNSQKSHETVPLRVYASLIMEYRNPCFSSSYVVIDRTYSMSKASGWSKRIQLLKYSK